MQMQIISQEKVEKFHKALPVRIRTYLNQRGIPDDIINKHKIGWNGSAIAIPIPNKIGEFIFFKYRKDPDDQSDKAKYWYDPGVSAELYGWENISEQAVVLCEGEFDRLVLESQGISAITSTGGAGTFKDEWIKELENIPNLSICYDCDDTGFDNAKKRLEKLPNAKFISLSGLPNGLKDITDFFVSGNTKEDFMKLIKRAKTLDELNFYCECLTGPEISFLHPSQDFIKDKGYFTIPSFEINPKEKNPTKQFYYVVTSDRKLLRLDDKLEFYNKYKLYIKHLPSIKNHETRWPKHLIKQYLFDGYTPIPIEVHQTLKEILMKYCEMKDYQWHYILPLWIIGTYFFSIFETYPYLAFEGIKNSGKSKAGRIIARMSFNGQASIGITEACLFRDTESLRYTVMIDEAEILKDKEKSMMIRAVLNAGFSKGTKVPRQEKTAGGEFFTRYYEVFSPKIIANTQGLEDTLESRTIKVIMLRAKTAVGNIVDTEVSEDWDNLRHPCYCFALSFFKEIRWIYLNDPDVRIANNRHNDLWCPLLAIAKFIFKDDLAEFNAIREFAVKQINSSQEESLDDWTTALLKALLDLSDKSGRYYSVKEIKEKMGIYLDDGEIDNIAPAWVGYRLRSFGFRKNRQSKGTQYSLQEDNVKDVAERYLNSYIPPQENPTHPTYSTLKNVGFMKS